MDQTDDAELVARARTGDVDAFSVLVERYRNPALRLAYGIAGDEAEDAVQDAFVKAYRKLDTFRPELGRPELGRPELGHQARAFRPWLFTVVANEARNHRRSMSRRTGLELRVRAIPQAVGAPSDAVAIEHEQREELVAAVNALSDDHREIVALRFFAGLSESETAAVLACPPGTAKSRLSRAMDALRVALGEGVTR
jgi:RNA polymerase sigma-70 factor (ECF subfamily)